MTNHYYKLNDFENIIYNGLQYSLSSVVIHNLQDLQKKMGITSVQSHRVVTTQKKPAYTEWKPIKNEPFNINIPEEKYGFEKDISTIRVCLNKISLKNYESQSQAILKIVDPYIKQQDSDSIMKIATIIFDISSSNTFLSELNAKLYKELIQSMESCESNLFLNMIEELFISYKQTYELSFFRVQPFSTKADVEELKNKQNDKRKAMTIFFVNLMKENIISSSMLLQYIWLLFSKIEEYIELKSYTNEVDEITENLFLFITMAHSALKELPEWDSLYAKICLFGEMKSKEKQSLSSRVVFKFKDLLDFL